MQVIKNIKTKRELNSLACVLVSVSRQVLGFNVIKRDSSYGAFQ